MGKGKHPEKVSVEWVFDVNPHPTKLDIEQNERTRQSIMDWLFRPISEERTKKLIKKP